jgi:hypothetical protein
VPCIPPQNKIKKLCVELKRWIRYNCFCSAFQQHLIPSYFSPIHLVNVSYSLSLRPLHLIYQELSAEIEVLKSAAVGKDANMSSPTPSSIEAKSTVNNIIYKTTKQN